MNGRLFGRIDTDNGNPPSARHIGTGPVDQPRVVNNGMACRNLDLLDVVLHQWHNVVERVIDYTLPTREYPDWKKVMLAAWNDAETAVLTRGVDKRTPYVCRHEFALVDKRRIGMHRQLAANFLRLFDDEGGNHSSILIHQNFHPGVEGVTDQPVDALAIFNIVVKLGAVQRLKPFRTQSFKSLEHLATAAASRNGTTT